MAITISRLLLSIQFSVSEGERPFFQQVSISIPQKNSEQPCWFHGARSDPMCVSREMVFFDQPALEAREAGAIMSVPLELHQERQFPNDLDKQIAVKCVFSHRTNISMSDFSLRIFCHHRHSFLLFLDVSFHPAVECLGHSPERHRSCFVLSLKL